MDKTKDTIKKEKNGRKKTNVDKKFLKRTYELSAKLLNHKQICASLDISHDTFYALLKKNADFSEAVRKGRANTIEKLTQAAVKQSYNEPDILMFLMKTKADFVNSDKRKELKIKHLQFELDRQKFEYEKSLNKKNIDETLNVFDDII